MPGCSAPAKGYLLTDKGFSPPPVNPSVPPRPPPLPLPPSLPPLETPLFVLLVLQVHATPNPEWAAFDSLWSETNPREAHLATSGQLRLCVFAARKAAACGMAQDRINVEDRPEREGDARKCVGCQKSLCSCLEGEGLFAVRALRPAIYLLAFFLRAPPPLFPLPLLPGILSFTSKGSHHPSHSPPCSSLVRCGQRRAFRAGSQAPLQFRPAGHGGHLGQRRPGRREERDRGTGPGLRLERGNAACGGRHV